MQPSEPIGHELISDLEHYDTKVLIDKINSSLGDNGAEGMMIGGIMRRTRLFAVLFVFTLVAAACSSTAQTTTTTTTPVQTTTTTKAATTTTATTTTATKVAQGDVVKGGLLYDKWWKVLSIDEPTGDMPLWANQSTNTRSGAATWRCKECHGWDYKGADGVYASGSHATGFPGIWDARDWTSEQIVAQLSGKNDPNHDFSAYLGHDELHALALFITDGMFDMSTLFDPNTKTPTAGDATEGEELYGTGCAACHGADGTQINFGDDAEPEYVGTVMVDNPWEGSHKIMFGQPGTGMPTGVETGLSIDELLDLIMYMQTFPTS